MVYDRDWGNIEESSSPAPINFLEKKERWWTRAIHSKRLLLAALVLFFLASGGIYAVHAMARSNRTDNPLAYDPVTLEPKAPEGLLQRLGHFVFSQDVTLSQEHDGRINVLLMGMGGAGHDGPNLTDTMILMSLKPATGQVAMISIPRDLVVDIPAHGLNKINAANAFGEQDKPNWGGALATQMVEKTLGVQIPYYARIDFQAFQEMIDTVGGITVNVDQSFVDTMYPTEDNGYKTVAFAKGSQNMDGRTALEYARSRHGSNNEGSDFARSRRQQKMILALRDKILSAETLTNPVRLNEIMHSLDTHLTTNMDFSDLMALVRLGRDLHPAHIDTLTLDTSDAGFLVSKIDANGAFVLVPKSGDFSDIQSAVAHIFDSSAATAVANHNELPVTPFSPTVVDKNQSIIEIQNGTWRAGLAATYKKQLTDAGFAVTAIGNTLERPQKDSGIYSIGGKASQTTLQKLSNTLHLSIRQTPPATIAPAATTDILIILGTDIPE